MMNFKTFTAVLCGLLVALTAGAATGKKISDYTETLSLGDAWIYEIAVPGVTNYKVTFGAMASNIAARVISTNLIIDGSGNLAFNTTNDTLQLIDTNGAYTGYVKLGGQSLIQFSNTTKFGFGVAGNTNWYINNDGPGDLGNYRPTLSNTYSLGSVTQSVEKVWVNDVSLLGVTKDRPLFLDASGNITNVSGTPNGSQFVRDDGALATPPGTNLVVGSPSVTFVKAGQRATNDNFIQSFPTNGAPGGYVSAVNPLSGEFVAMMQYAYGHAINYSNTRGSLEFHAGWGGGHHAVLNLIGNAGANGVQFRNNSDTDSLEVSWLNSVGHPEISTEGATTPMRIGPKGMLWVNSPKAVWVNTNLFVTNNFVGVSTTYGLGPAALLHVYADDNNDSGQYNGAQLRVSSFLGTKRLNIGYDPAVNYAFLQAFDTDASATPIALNPGGGNVGIATTTSTNRLDVNGHASIRSNLFLANLRTNATPLSLLTLDGDGAVYETATTVFGSTQMVTAAIGTLTVTNALSVGTLNVNLMNLTNFLTSNQVRLGVQQLTNVALANLQAGQSMVWNSSADKWTNANLMAANVISNITVTATNDLLLDFSMANIFKIRLLTNFSYRFTNSAYLLNKGYVYFQQDAVGVRLLNTFLVEGGALQTNANMQPTTNALALDVLEVMPGLLTTNLICWWPQNFQPRVDFPGSSVATFTDNFDRQASDPMSTTASGGGTWTSGPGLMGDCLIEFNFLRGGTPSDNAARILSPTFATNQSARIQLVNDAANFVSTGPMVRIQSTTDASGYVAAIQSTTSIKIQRVTDNGATVSYADIGLAFTVATLVVGDTVTLGISGNTLTLYVNGVSQGTRPDSTFLTGQPGIWFFNQIGIAENFYATDL